MGDEIIEENRQGVKGFTEAINRNRTRPTRSEKRTVPPRRGNDGRTDRRPDTRTETTEKVEEEKFLAVGVTPQTVVPAETENFDQTESVSPTKTPQTAPEQGVPKQVSVNPDVPVKEEKAAKPKRRSPKKKQSGMDMKQVDALIVGISDYVAARPNMAHWKMSEKEVQSITQPLGNIIAKSDYMEKLAENSDEIALVLAVGAVFVPRAIISFSMIKKNKKDKEKNKNVQLRSEEKPDKISNGDSPTDNGNPDDVPSVGRDLSFLGNGIAVY